MSAWTKDHVRVGWVVMALRDDIARLRIEAARARQRFVNNSSYWGEPTEWMAHSYEAAADVLEARINALTDDGLPF